MNASSYLSYSLWTPLLLAVVLALSWFVLQGREGINLADEGFLWYGVQRTLAGAVPLRDFQAYDPGRYYWSALGARLFGRGLVALRFSETLFQILGLWVGLLIASRIMQDGWFLAAVGVLLVLWMFPSFKLFDHTFLLWGIWVAVRLLEEPSPSRLFIAGAFVGISLFFGRNHTLYNLLAQAVLLMFLHAKSSPLSFQQVEMWVTGIAIGLIPTMGMLLCVTGFSSSYIKSVQAIFRHGTNLSIPVAWPWRISPFASSIAATRFLVGVLFVALPLGYLAGVMASISMDAAAIRNHAVFIGCAFVGLFYLHHAFSRPDLSHLAQSIHPFSFLVLALAGALDESALCRWGALAALLVLAVFTIGRQSPRYQRCVSAKRWVPFDAGNRIFLSPSVSRLLTSLRDFARENIPARDGVLIAPFTPALYSILGHESPLWDIAFYTPAPAARQVEMIRRLSERGVNWAIISEAVPDQREDLRFSATHALVWRDLIEEFEPVECASLPKSVKILRRKRAALLPK